MANPKNIVPALIFFFFGAMFSVVAYYTIPILLDTISEVTTTMGYTADTLLQPTFYVGLIALWVCAIIVIPVLMIMSDEPVMRN